MNEAFRKFSSNVSNLAGSPGVFLIMILVILVWAVTGPLFQFSDTWPLVINTRTTIVTFLRTWLKKR